MEEVAELVDGGDAEEEEERGGFGEGGWARGGCDGDCGG